MACDINLVKTAGYIFARQKKSNSTNAADQNRQCHSLFVSKLDTEMRCQQLFTNLHKTKPVGTTLCDIVDCATQILNQI